MASWQLQSLWRKLRPHLRYVAFGGMCLLALRGREVHFSRLSAESLLFCCCVIVVVHDMMSEKLSPLQRVDDTSSKKNFTEFEQFLTSKKRSAKRGADHIIQRVTHEWKLDSSIANETSMLIKLVVRDYIHYWFVNVSKRTDFLVDVEEILTYAICTLVRRGHDFINPYMFVGDKVCDVLVRTMSLFRQTCQRVLKEHPGVDRSSREFHMLVANEFRHKGNLHISMMAAGVAASDEIDADSTSRTDTFKQNMKHAMYNSASDLSMEEFFDTDRLTNIESEYSFYVGSFLTKFLIDSKEENSKAVRHLFTEILSNILLGSIYWLCTPSSVYYYVHMALSLHQSETNASDNRSDGDFQNRPFLSEIDLHIGLKDYFVGVIGEENVSSSCCAMTIEAAAAIVLREGCKERLEGSEYGDKMQVQDDLPPPGHFILRQFSNSSNLRDVSLLPAVLCLSYVRSCNPVDRKTTNPHWQMTDTAIKSLSSVFDSMNLTALELLRPLSNEKAEAINGLSQISYRDSRVGHVIILAHTGSSSNQGLSYEILSCSHELDLKAALAAMEPTYFSACGVDKSLNLESLSTESRPVWSNFEELLTALKGVVHDRGLQLLQHNGNTGETEVTGAKFDRSNSSNPESIGSPVLQEVDEEEMSNERTLLLVEKNILINHELEGSVEEYLGKKIAHENKIIQISHTDESGRQAIRRLIEAIENVCVHGWLKKRFVASHPGSVASTVASSRDEGGRYIATLLSKMYAKVLLQTSYSATKNVGDNTYEEFLHKSPALWLWVSHIISHCKGKKGDSTILNNSSHLPGPESDNSMSEKMSISQHCKCLSCNRTDCYVYSMEIFLDHHGSFYVNKEITVDTLFECMLFCGLQTGKIVDMIEITSLLMICEGHYSDVNTLALESLEKYKYEYSPQNVAAVSGLSSQELPVIPADQFAPEALLRSCGDSAHAMSHLHHLRDHYLHYFKHTDDTNILSSSVTNARSIINDTLFASSPQTPAKERKRPNMFKSMSKTFSAASSLFDDFSNSLASPNRVLELEPQKKLPRHLTFSSNEDIVQVSNIKFETAQDKWHRKVGEGVLFGSELQRRAEVAFVLRILLRDRPPMEFLESRNIIRHQRTKSPIALFSSYNIEILKYEKLTMPSSAQPVVVYYIDVYRKRANVPCPVHREISIDENLDKSSVISTPSTGSAAVTANRVRIYPHKCTCKKWTIKRRYTDFDELHKHLKNHLSNNLFNKFKLPQKAYVQVVQSSFFYARRLMGLREYLRSLLVGLPDMAELHIFLAPDDDAEALNASASPPQHEKPLTADVSSSATVVEAMDTSNVITPSSDSNPPSDEKIVLNNVSAAEPSTVDKSSLSQHTSQISKATEKVSANLSAETLPTSNSAPSSDKGAEESFKVTLDPRVVDLLETRVYALLDEMLEVDGISVIKRNMVSLLCKSIGIFFNGTVVKWMQHQSRPDTAAAQITSLIGSLRNMFWPNDTLIEFGMDEQDENVILETDRALRAECIAKLNSFLPNLLQGHHIVEGQFLLFDNPFILKSLSYMIIDLLIIDLFPELANKLSGMDCLQK